VLNPGQQVGSYVVEGILGEGGMATVYRVRHAYLGTRHAMKVLSPELSQDVALRERFVTEARIQALLRHANIVPVTDVVVGTGVVGVVMDLVEGTSLADWHEAHPALPDDDDTICRIFLQVLDGLAFVHAKGIIHRDVKPANILLQISGSQIEKALLLDFGIAKAPDEGNRSTRSGARMGTPAYMSPEQIRSAKDVDARSDLFSLGVALYECATNRLPFDAESDFDVQAKIVAGLFVPASSVRPHLSPDWDAFFSRALAQAASARFQTAAEFRAALLTLLPATSRRESVPAPDNESRPKPDTQAGPNDARRGTFGRGRLFLLATLLIIAVGSAAVTLMSGSNVSTAADAQQEKAAPTAQETSAPLTQDLGGSPQRRVRIIGDPSTDARATGTSQRDGTGLSERKADSPKLAPPSPVDLRRKPPKSSGTTGLTVRETAKYDTAIAEAAEKYKLPPELIRSIIVVESNFDPVLRGPGGRIGLMQLTPKTSAEMFVSDPRDPEQSIHGGARYLRIIANEFKGDLVAIIAAYHAGPEAVRKAGGVPPDADTQSYLRRVVKIYRIYKGVEQ
jgi:serine/threonine protein kinase